MSIEFESLKNIRDLGGMTTKNGGVIKNNSLYRSSHLGSASDGDIIKLAQLNVRHVVDFRTESEVAERPDRKVEGSDYHHWSALTDRKLGITLDKDSAGQLAKTVEHFLASKGQAKRDMLDLYVSLIEDEAGIAAYRNFLTLLSTQPEGAVLWHCSLGKDRAGLATMFALECLGVSKDDIIEDYLKTNGNINDRVEEFIQNAQEVNSDPDVPYVVRDLLTADRDYIEKIYSYVSDKYGTMKLFISDCLGISEEMQDNIKKRYLNI